MEIIKVSDIMKIIEETDDDALLQHESLTGLLQYFKQKFKQIGSKVLHSDSLHVSARNNIYIKDELVTNKQFELMRKYAHELESMIPRSKYRESKNFETDKNGFNGVDVYCIKSPKSKFLKEVVRSGDDVFWISFFYNEHSPDYFGVVTTFSIPFTNWFTVFDIFNFKKETDEHGLKFSPEELEQMIDELKHYIDIIVKAIRLLGNA